MEKLLENKKILIAGAGGLLGANLVSEVLEQGASVIAADLNVAGLKECLLSKGVNVNSKDIELIELDITDESSVENIFFNHDFNGAVNATYPRNKEYGKHFLDVSLNSFNENLSLHLGSAFLFSQQAAAYFIRKGEPFSLVNISSIYGVVAPDFDIYSNTSMTMPVEYAAIKAAILHLNKYIVSYVKNSDFRINSVSPGGIYDGQPEIFLNAYKEKTNGKGMLSVKEVLGGVMFLLSEQSRYITAQNIVVDDGFSL
ncbi:flagellin modification protein A [Marinomonas piezotolerans]|uniref:Flagellin modification protein A n=2 Tax=Marinomonas piezotolerans TaxID=2213058 RepID=A0A370U8A2_9GAMM|nr:flagellin modification protein A [Marinomonas piezotolerans]